MNGKAKRDGGNIIDLFIPGAEASELYFSKAESTRLEFAEGSIKVKESAESGGYGLRVLKQGRLGFAHFASEAGYADAIKNALALSKHSKKTRFSFAPKRKFPRLKTWSDKTADTDEREMRDIVMQIRGAADKYAGNGRVLLERSTSAVRIKNSEGLDSSCKWTGVSAYCEAMEGDGFGFAFQSSTGPLKDPHAFGEAAGQMCRDMKGAKKIPSGKYDVVFTTEALLSMLGILTPSLSGDWKRRKISRLWNMKGRKIVSDKFTLHDDATAGASSITPFDDEGVPSRRMPLFERGVLKNFLYTREVAALEGCRAEGSCGKGSYSDKPAISPSNLVIAPGEVASLDEVLRDYILVKSVHGVHTSNTTTGDFGVEANVAFRISNGKKTGARGFIISGNIFNLFSNIIALERKQQVYDDLVSPSIAFGGVQVIG